MTQTAKQEDKLLKCTFSDCTWSFQCDYKLNRHLRSHTGEKTHVCETCKKSFSNRYNLTSHLKTHNKITCEYQNCKKLFEKKSELQKHVNEEHVMTLQCTHKRCMLSFTSKAELTDHMENHNLQHKCTFDGCTQRFKKPSLLKLHMMVHTGELPYKCDFAGCNKAFVNQQRLTRHQLIHKNKRDYVCDVKGCNKSFNRSEYLKTHTRTHDVLKKYVCPLQDCQQLFVCAETLKIHLQRHANIRPYSCNHLDCHKTYLTASNLKAHKKTHLIEKPVRKKKTVKNNVTNKSVAIETVPLNDFINMPLLDVTPILSKEDIIAAAFGEFACNQYISKNETLPLLSQDELNSNVLPNSFVDSISLNDDFIVTDIDDIQFQEEFVSSIYAPSINNYRTFISGHDYEQCGVVNDTQSESRFLIDHTGNEFQNLEHDMRISSDIENMLEPSMELSTGHLEIDGGYFGASSCMPDHIYSHQTSEKSTVNLQDIR